MIAAVLLILLADVGETLCLRRTPGSVPSRTSIDEHEAGLVSSDERANEIWPMKEEIFLLAFLFDMHDEFDRTHHHR